MCRFRANGPKSKPKVDFQYGARLFFKNGSSYISAINWDMSTKFGLLINFDLLKAAISTNAKPEIVLLRFGRHVVLSRLPPRPLNTTGISGFAFLNIAAFRRSKSISKPNFGSEAPKAWESRRHRRRGGGDLSHEERPPYRKQCNKTTRLKADDEPQPEW